jgi:hypothetical protein
LSLAVGEDDPDHVGPLVVTPDLASIPDSATAIRRYFASERWDVPESLDPPALRMIPAHSDRDFSRGFG